jgi:hypothetical protein
VACFGAPGSSSLPPLLAVIGEYELTNRMRLLPARSSSSMQPGVPEGTPIVSPLVSGARPLLCRFQGGRASRPLEPPALVAVGSDSAMRNRHSSSSSRRQKWRRACAERFVAAAVVHQKTVARLVCAAGLHSAPPLSTSCTQPSPLSSHTTTHIAYGAPPQAIPSRPRRNRRSETFRSSTRETWLHPSHFILPLFIHEEGATNQPIPSMPGIYRLAFGKNVVDHVAEARSLGVNQVRACVRVSCVCGGGEGCTLYILVESVQQSTLAPAH